MLFVTNSKRNIMCTPDGNKTRGHANTQYIKCFWEVKMCDLSLNYIEFQYPKLPFFTYKRAEYYICQWKSNKGRLYT